MTTEKGHDMLGDAHSDEAGAARLVVNKLAQEQRHTRSLLCSAQLCLLGGQ